MSVRKMEARYAAVYLVGSVMKWANLVRQSTMAQIVVLPFELGRWVIKSFEISSHTCSGIGNG